MLRGWGPGTPLGPTAECQHRIAWRFAQAVRARHPGGRQRLKRASQARFAGAPGVPLGALPIGPYGCRSAPSPAPQCVLNHLEIAGTGRMDLFLKNTDRLSQDGNVKASQGFRWTLTKMAMGSSVPGRSTLTLQRTLKPTSSEDRPIFPMVSITDWWLEWIKTEVILAECPELYLHSL